MNISDNEGVMELIDILQAGPPPESFEPRFNVAPTMPITCIGTVDNAGAEAADVTNTVHTTHTMKWGLIPSWAKPGQFKSPLINARAETIWEKPSFRSAVKHGRVIIPITGFYEWKREGKTRQAFYIKSGREKYLALAGVSSVSAEGVPQVAVVTTAANPSMVEVHHRMPVILTTDEADLWLDANDRDLLQDLTGPCGDDAIDVVAVSDYVNNARNTGPECMTPRS